VRNRKILTGKEGDARRSEKRNRSNLRRSNVLGKRSAIPSSRKGLWWSREEKPSGGEAGIKEKKRKSEERERGEDLQLKLLGIAN